MLITSNCTVELTLSIPRKVKSIRGNVERHVTLGTIDFAACEEVRHDLVLKHVFVKRFDFVTNLVDDLVGMQSNDDVSLYEFNRMPRFGINAVWYYHIKDKNLLVKCSLNAHELWQYLYSLYREDKLPAFTQFAVKCEPCVR